MSGIDKQIVKGEDYSLSTNDILRITDNKCKVIAYEELEHISSIDELLEPHGAAIILYENSDDGLYGHWTALFKTDQGTLEFFDPYAIKLDGELNLNNDFNFRVHNGVEVAHLSHLISQSEYKVKSNKVQLQEVKKHVNTCGRWTALRIRFRDVSIRRFIDLMTKNEAYKPDFWVTALTLLV